MSAVIAQCSGSCGLRLHACSIGMRKFWLAEDLVHHGHALHAICRSDKLTVKLQLFYNRTCTNLSEFDEFRDSCGCRRIRCYGLVHVCDMLELHERSLLLSSLAVAIQRPELNWQGHG